MRKTIIAPIILSLLITTACSQAENQAASAPETINWDITKTAFCTTDTQQNVQLLEETKFFNTALKKNNLEPNNAGSALAVECIKQNSVSAPIAQAFNKIAEDSENNGGSTVTSTFETLFNSSGENYQPLNRLINDCKREFNSIKEIENSDLNCLMENKPNTLQAGGFDPAKSQLCASWPKSFNGPKYRELMTKAHELGDGAGTSLPDYQGVLSPELYVMTISSLCNDSSYKAGNVSADVEEYLFRLKRNLMILDQ